MTHNLIQMKIFKCFLVTCGRLNQLQHEKSDQGLSFISGGETCSLFLREQCRLQRANRHVFMLALHADVLRDVRATHKIKQTPTERVVASQIVR